MLHKIAPGGAALSTFKAPRGAPKAVDVVVEAEKAVAVYILTADGVRAFERGRPQLEGYFTSSKKKAHAFSFTPEPQKTWGLMIFNPSRDRTTAYEDVRW